jgi:hypothetical protein
MILALSAAVVAKISLGVDVSYRVYNSYTENSVSGGSGQERDNHSTQIGLTPVLGMISTPFLHHRLVFIYFLKFTTRYMLIYMKGSKTQRSTPFWILEQFPSFFSKI